MQMFYIYSVTCLSAFYLGKAHLVDEETEAQSGPEFIHLYHSTSLCRGERAELE